MDIEEYARKHDYEFGQIMFIFNIFLIIAEIIMCIVLKENCGKVCRIITTVYITVWAVCQILIKIYKKRFIMMLETLVTLICIAMLGITIGYFYYELQLKTVYTYIIIGTIPAIPYWFLTNDEQKTNPIYFAIASAMPSVAVILNIILRWKQLYGRISGTETNSLDSLIISILVRVGFVLYIFLIWGGVWRLIRDVKKKTNLPEPKYLGEEPQKHMQDENMRKEAFERVFGEKNTNTTYTLSQEQVEKLKNEIKNKRSFGRNLQKEEEYVFSQIDNNKAKIFQGRIESAYRDNIGGISGFYSCYIVVNNKEFKISEKYFDELKQDEEVILFTKVRKNAEYNEATYIIH